MTRPNVGVYYASPRHFLILLLENIEKEWFMSTPHCRATFYPTPCQLRDVQPLPNSGWHGNSLCPLWVFLGDPLCGPWGVVPRCFNPLHVRLRVGTIRTQFHSQTIPENVTTKHYDTIVRQRRKSRVSFSRK